MALDELYICINADNSHWDFIRDMSLLLKDLLLFAKNMLGKVAAILSSLEHKEMLSKGRFKSEW